MVLFAQHVPNLETYFSIQGACSRNLKKVLLFHVIAPEFRNNLFQFWNHAPETETVINPWYYAIFT